MSYVRAMISFCVLVRFSNFDLQISILSYSLITTLSFWISTMLYYIFLSIIGSGFKV